MRIEAGLGSTDGRGDEGATAGNESTLLFEVRARPRNRRFFGAMTTEVPVLLARARRMCGRWRLSAGGMPLTDCGSTCCTGAVTSEIDVFGGEGSGNVWRVSEIGNLVSGFGKECFARIGSARTDTAVGGSLTGVGFETAATSTLVGRKAKGGAWAGTSSETSSIGGSAAIGVVGLGTMAGKPPAPRRTRRCK